MLSVLIVNWNTKELLARCLESLFQNSPTCEFEVIVVDNNSGDDSAGMVRSRFPQAVLIEPRANTGYARGNNLAFAVARGSWLLTLNPDTEIGAGVLDSAIRELEHRPGYGCLSVRFLGLNGETQRSVRGFPTLAGLFGQATGLARRFPGSKLDSYELNAFSYDSSGPAPQPMGTFLLFRSSALASVGSIQRPFDESFPIFFNEVDLLRRLFDAGWLCHYEARLTIKHVHGASTKLVRKNMIWESHRSLVHYLLKHSGFGSRLFLRCGGAAIIYAAAFIRAKGFHAGFRA